VVSLQESRYLYDDRAGREDAVGQGRIPGRAPIVVLMGGRSFLDEADVDEPGLPAVHAQAREQFDALVADVRTELHHYCARMTGSVVDGEDVVQDALAKAYYMLPTVGTIGNLRGWLFRIAHNRAIDFLRRYDHRFAEPLDDHPDLVADDAPLDAAEQAEFALSHYLKLTALQRSCVILKDVMDYSLAEISEVLDVSVPAIKGALHRGRAALRDRVPQATEEPARLDAHEARLLALYVTHFNARNFNALRDLLVDDAKLELVGRTHVRGAQGVGSYFDNYDRLTGWRMAIGMVDDRPAVLGFDDVGPDAGPDSIPPADPRPAFFVLVSWRNGQISAIRDYRYARHVMELARITLLDTLDSVGQIVAAPTNKMDRRRQ
jgi:RNA polymerase sigma-70 factor (ECF subfamily)